MVGHQRQHNAGQSFSSKERVPMHNLLKESFPMSTSKSRWSRLPYLLVVVLLLSVPAPAQTITGSIAGTVTDPNGSIIPGAMVTITSDKTNEVRNVTTNDEGRFSFTAVQPGVYTVKVEREGFQTLERRGTVLSANENLA